MPYLFFTVLLFCTTTALTSPTIVWWTNELYPHLQSSNRISCPSSNCYSTHKKIPKRKSNSTVAFIFYGSDFDPENLPLPRRPNHVWALLHEESPMNNYIFSHYTGIRLFNYTGTFSRYSDFPLTTQFVPTIEYLTERRPLTISRKNELRKLGFAPVLYVQSHCHIASDRDRYVRELMKYVSIDSCGTCIRNKNLPENINTTTMYASPSFHDFISQYKFHIAFENALCDDYITEKLFRSFHVGSVPIYKGSPTIRDWEPSENSIILADDFDSPRALADFILKLDGDDELYGSYLKFKTNVSNGFLRETLGNRTWGVNDIEKDDFTKGFECFICEQVSRKVPGSTKTATRSHMNCHQPHQSIDIPLVANDEWLKEDWIESYWFAFDQARAIQKMTESNESDSSTFFNYVAKLKYNH